MFKRNVMNLNYKYPGSFPQLAKDLCRKILRVRMSDRLTIDEILEHPWLQTKQMIKDKEL